MQNLKQIMRLEIIPILQIRSGSIPVKPNYGIFRFSTSISHQNSSKPKEYLALVLPWVLDCRLPEKLIKTVVRGAPIYASVDVVIFPA